MRTIYLPDSLSERIQELADERGASLDMLVQEAVEAYLEQMEVAEPSMTIAQIRAEANQRAATLRALPREQIATDLLETVERIRQEAIKKGVAVEDEWRGD
jgi:predicted transcriptional regulator